MRTRPQLGRGSYLARRAARTARSPDSGRGPFKWRRRSEPSARCSPRGGGGDSPLAAAGGGGSLLAAAGLGLARLPFSGQPQKPGADYSVWDRRQTPGSAGRPENAGRISGSEEEAQRSWSIAPGEGRCLRSCLRCSLGGEIPARNPGSGPAPRAPSPPGGCPQSAERILPPEREHQPPGAVCPVNPLGPGGGRGGAGPASGPAIPGLGPERPWPASARGRPPAPARSGPYLRHSGAARPAPGAAAAASLELERLPRATETNTYKISIKHSYNYNTYLRK
ncbi:uncharacterized protein [Lepidochelys kempii]|uniref:uncharacterized protein n=1 Tax=Lepidochelys kempii TaxID=8472 RepID=UPI003C6F9550